MRTLSLVDCVELKFSGSVLKNAVCFGDCDNDSQSEFIIGSSDGDLAIFRDSKCICGASELGTIAALAVGDLLNISKNFLVVVTAEGWCHVFDVESELGFPGRAGLEEADSPPQFLCPDHLMISPFHSQRIPPNTKTLHLGDINGDGLAEMIVGLTDRVVRTYQWKMVQDEIDEKLVTGNSKDTDGRSEGSDVYDGRLFGLNKWEFANQVGSIALHKTGGFVSILVGQPGGTVTQITDKSVVSKERSELSTPAVVIASTFSNSSTVLSSAGGTIGLSRGYGCVYECQMANERISGSPLENITIDYHTLDVNHVYNQNISSEVAGNVSDGIDDDCYAVSTLDGTIMVAKGNEIQWSLQVGHQILSLFQINGKILACSWDGDTYLIDRKIPIRFHFEDSVAVFVPGVYAIREEGSSAAPDELVNKLCMAFVTFNEKIYIYPVDLLAGEAT